MKTQDRQLIIDGQVFQTGAWHRGMGKYSFALLKALFEDTLRQEYKSITIVFNKNLKIEREALKAVKKACPDVPIVYTDLLLPSSSLSVKRAQAVNQARLDQIVTEMPQKVDYLILSLFLDETCVVFPSNARKLLLFYDLIPYLYYDRYQNRIKYDDYLDHFKTIFEADIIFTISQTVADDLEVFLGIDKQRLWNINGASINRSVLTSKKPQIKIPEKFILMPSGDELRKNNLRAVKGFEEFNATHNNKYSLVITSKFSDYNKAELQRYSKNLVFTGNVLEQELQWLYEKAELVLFASEYEGLGLPVLEAMSVSKKVACSDIPVFEEISPDAFYFFDYLDPSSIAQVIDKALFSEDWLIKQKKYKNILKKYTWEQSAKEFIKAKKQILDSGTPAPTEIKKPKIAIFTPHPAGYSAIGKVVAESHDSTRKFFDVDYYFDYGAYHRPVRAEFLSHIANCADATTFNASRYKEYDAVIYHIGNSDYHLESIKNALYLPGYAILHDTFLDGAYESLLRAGYMSKERLDLETLLNKCNRTNTSRFLTSIVNNQLGVITHSDYAKDAAKSVIDSKNIIIQQLNLPVSTPSPTNRLSGSFQIGLAGILADVKGLRIIEDIASMDTFKDSIIHVFGYSFAKPAVIKQFSKWPHVKVHTNPTDLEFQTKLSRLDALVNYRLEYRGETSLTTLEGMRYGVAVIVRGDVGWYAELPEDSIVRATNLNEVIDKLLELHDVKTFRERVGRSARALTASTFSHDAYAKGLADIVERGINDANLANLRLANILKEQDSLRKIKGLLNIS